MLREEIHELYLFQARRELSRKYSNIKQDRKSIILYDFDEFKWILLPEHLDDLSKEDLDLYDKKDPTNVLFLDTPLTEKVKHYLKCRKLTEKDRYHFEEFQKASPEKDKKRGMVSLADPVVYGCFVDGKIVSVASLWNWGNRISDIGILTHPEYRGKGYAKAVCQKLIHENNRLYIWRCETNNEVSCKLAKQLGFQKAGMIYNLTMKGGQPPF